MAIERIGHRVGKWRRRRGMSQKILAELSGLSQPYISQIETGARALDQKSTQVAIATALNVSVSQLLGQPSAAGDPMRDNAMAHVPAIRSTLVELDAGERRSPERDRDTLRAALRDMTELRNGGEYDKAAPLLPALLNDIAGHGAAMAPELVEALFYTTVILKNVSHRDLAREAAHLGVSVAEGYDDPVCLAQARYAIVQSLPPENASLGAKVAARVANDLQPVSDSRAHEVRGQLHLASALHAAVASRPDDASAHLTEAADIARVLGEPAPYGRLSAGLRGDWFGPTNVDYWRVSVAAELHDTGTAIEVAKRIDLAAVAVPNRWVYYWTDYSRALATAGKGRESMYALASAERAAPLHFRFNPIVNDVAASIIRNTKRTAEVRELREMAGNLGLLN